MFAGAGPFIWAALKLLSLPEAAAAGALPSRRSITVVALQIERFRLCATRARVQLASDLQTLARLCLLAFLAPHTAILSQLLPGHMIADVVAILGSLDFVMGECDR